MKNEHCEADLAASAELAELQALVERQAKHLEALEAKLDNQEQSLRHVLGMMIEWMEEGQSREAA